MLRKWILVTLVLLLTSGFSQDSTQVILPSEQVKALLEDASLYKDCVKGESLRDSLINNLEYNCLVKDSLIINLEHTIALNDSLHKVNTSSEDKWLWSAFSLLIGLLAGTQIGN